MDKLTLEKTKTEEKIAKETQKETLAKPTPVVAQPQEKKAENVQFSVQMQTSTQEKLAPLPAPPTDTPIYNEYISTFDNMTIFDIMHKERQEAVDKAKSDMTIASAIKMAKEKEQSLATESKEREEEKVVESVTQEQVQVAQEVQEEKVQKLVIEKPNYDFMSKSKSAPKKKKKSKLKTALIACALAISCLGAVTGTVIIDNLNSSYIELQDTYDINLFKYLRDINNLNTTNKTLDYIETYPEDVTEISTIGETTNWFDNLVNFITGLFGG